MSTTTTPPEAPSVALDQQLKTAIQKVSEGSIDFKALVNLLAPPPEYPTPPAEAPLPPVITEEQRAALERVLEVFGQVVPTTRRTLTTPEVASLLDERLTLDSIEEMAKKRKEGIRTSVCNHLDCEIEVEAAAAQEAGESFEMPHRDKDGHYVKEGKLGAPGKPKQFSRETRAGSVSFDEGTLRLLADDPTLNAKLVEAGVTFTHEDYLAMTSQKRVWDEAKVMMHLRKRPELIHAIRAAIVSGPRTAAVCLRKP